MSRTIVPKGKGLERDEFWKADKSRTHESEPKSAPPRKGVYKRTYMDLEYVISHWEAVRAGLIDTANKFRDEDLDFRPFATSWSVRQIMLHIAQEENGEFNYGITRKLQEFPAEYDVQNYPTRVSIVSLLAFVHSPNIEYLKALDEDDLGRVINTPWGTSYRLIEMIDHLIEHEIHHRAELSLILGMLGREGLNA